MQVSEDFIKKHLKKINFESKLRDLISKYKEKRIVVFGAEGLSPIIFQNYNLQNLNIIGISDEIYKEDSPSISLNGYNTISISKLEKLDFDVILIARAMVNKNKEMLEEILPESIKSKIIIDSFIEDTNWQNVFYKYYLEKVNFKNRITKLAQKYKNKKIAIYGTGDVFDLIDKNYNLKLLNPIAVADRKFEKIFLDNELKENLENKLDGYKLVTPAQLLDLKPDVVLVSTFYSMKIIESLEYDLFKDNNKVKILPLINKKLWDFIDEIWKMC